jgi:hypothetical protein
MEFKVLGKRVSHADDEKLLMQMTKNSSCRLLDVSEKKKKKKSTITSMIGLMCMNCYES